MDRAFDYQLIPEWMTGGPDAAVAVLSTIAASMVSLAALVLTITMVVVQLAMGQFSPRIVQTFLRDRPSQFAIGLFVATFAHAMVAMREVNFDDDKVPGVAIVVSYLLVLTSIVMLVLYVTLLVAQGDGLDAAALPWAILMAAAAALAGIAARTAEPTTARNILIPAVGLFLLLGVLAILSIGIGFLVAAALGITAIAEARRQRRGSR